MKYKFIPENVTDCIKQLIIFIVYIVVVSDNISKVIITKTNIYFTPIAVLVGYMFGDLFSGLYHYFMDTYDISFIKEYCSLRNSGISPNVSE